MNDNFWKDKKVLITGHNGFKGTWLSKWLDKLGAKVCGISLAPESGNEYRKLTFSENFQGYELDITDRSSLGVIKEFSPEIVIHLAALAIVKDAKENPSRTFETNVMGTVNLLEELSRTSSVKSIIVVTSDKVYENTEQMKGYIESDSLMGSEAYSCSKVCEEQVAKSYYESIFKNLGIGVTTARASNCFGGGDYHFDRLIPYLEMCAFKGVSPEIRNPKSVRPWQYVLDILAGYMRLAEELYNNPNEKWESFNFGPDEEELYSVGDISNLISKKAISQKEKQDYYEAGLLLIDSKKSREVLGWRPLYKVKEGLEITTKLFEEYFKNGNSDKIYDDAIREYSNLYNR